MRPLESSDFDDDSTDQPLGLSDSSVISESLFNDGVRAFKKKDYPRAILCFKEALADNPEDENCRKNLLSSLFKAGVQEFKSKSFEDAIGRFTAVLDMEPSWEQAQINLANSHMCYAQSFASDKDDDMAEFHFIQAIECSDQFAAGMLQLGEFYLHRRRFKDAYARFKDLIELRPDDTDSLKRLAETSRQYANQLIKEKKYKAAEKVLKLARKNYKKLGQESFDVERGSGIVYFHTEQYSQAADAFRAALEINIDHAVTRRDFALSLLHIANTLSKKKLKRAEAAYKEALSLNVLNSEGHVSGLVNLGALYFNHKKFDEAIEPLEEALDIDETHKQARAYLIRVYIVRGFRRAQAGDSDGAIEEYGKCLELDAKSFRALVRLGYVCYVTQNYEMAADWFKRGLSIKPNHARTRQNYEACLKLAQADEEDLYVMMGELQVEDLAAPEEIADLPEMEESGEDSAEDTEIEKSGSGRLKIPESIASDPELNALVSSGPPELLDSEEETEESVAIPETLELDELGDLAGLDLEPEVESLGSEDVESSEAVEENFQLADEVDDLADLDFGGLDDEDDVEEDEEDSEDDSAELEAPNLADLDLDEPDLEAPDLGELDFDDGFDEDADDDFEDDSFKAAKLDEGELDFDETDSTVSDDELTELADLPDFDSEESDDEPLSLPADFDEFDAMTPEPDPLPGLESSDSAPVATEAAPARRPVDDESFAKFTSAKNPFAAFGNDAKGAFLNMQSLVDADSEMEMSAPQELESIPADEIDDFFKNNNDDGMPVPHED